MPKTITQTIKEIPFDRVENNLRYYWKNILPKGETLGVMNSIFLLSEIGAIADERNSDHWASFFDWYLRRYVKNRYQESIADFANCCYEYGIANKSYDNFILIQEGFEASSKRVPELIKWINSKY